MMLETVIPATRLAHNSTISRIIIASEGKCPTDPSQGPYSLILITSGRDIRCQASTLIFRIPASTV